MASLFGRRFLQIAACLCVPLVLSSCARADVNESASPLSFSERRKQFTTHLLKEEASQQEYERTVPPDMQAVWYTSQGRKLLAWLAIPPGGGKHPAVVFAHGGFALGSGDWDEIKPFYAAGFAVMLPAWRGENGNPGYSEMCYGEVDDANAAINYLASRPDIDRSNIFGAGHSVGATIMMLTAELNPNLKKVAAAGGLPSMAAAGRAYAGAPFNQFDLDERLLRSPGAWLKDLRCPLLLVYAPEDPGDRMMLEQAREMQRNTLSKFPIRIEEVSGVDHYHEIPQAVPIMIRYFQQSN